MPPFLIRVLIYVFISIAKNKKCTSVKGFHVLISIHVCRVCGLQVVGKQICIIIILFFATFIKLHLLHLPDNDISIAHYTPTN